MVLSQRISAFLAYLLSVVGWLFVIFFDRKSVFSVFHLKQSIGLLLYLIGVTLGWIISAWILALIPYAGGLTAAMLFSLVIAAYISGFVIWVVGMVNALRGEMNLLPLVGRLSNRLPLERFLG